jgi:cofilin
MAATGVSVADSALAEYNAFKLSSNPGKYMLFKIEGGSVVVDKTSEDSDFSNFLGELRDDDCRYIVYKKTVEFDDGRSSEKLVFISW